MLHKDLVTGGRLGINCRVVFETFVDEMCDCSGIIVLSIYGKH